MKKSISLNKIIFFFLAFIIWALAALNTYTVDRSNYEMFYAYAGKGIHYPGIEVGFYYLMRFASIVGMSFQNFLIMYSSVAIIIFFKAIRKYISKGINIILALFIYFPYLHLVATLRNFMASVILIFAIQFLIEDNKKSKYKYCICVIIAACFHIFSISALLFLLCKLPYKRIKNIAMVFSVIGFFVLIFGSEINSVLIKLIPKLSVYILDGMNGTRGVTKVFLFIYFISKCVFCVSLPVSDKEDRLILIFRNINLILLVFLPLCMYNMNFMRMEYDLFILMAIFVYKNVAENNDAENKKIITVLFFAYYLLSGYILLYLFSYESIVKNVWENNFIFKSFL